MSQPVSELPPPPAQWVLPPPSPRASRARRLGVAALKFVLCGVAFWVLVQIAAVGMRVATWKAAIPASCRQPSSVDYSHASRPAYGRYSVKFSTSSKVPWGRTSMGLVGHGQTADSDIGYGLPVDVESSDIARFRCRWTTQGVTIIEPPSSGDRFPQIEHFVPAEQFLGGR